MRYDVVIIGAGSAGAATALSCARRGLATLCLDARPLAQAGASWVNAVPRSVFSASEIEAPRGEEHINEGAPFSLIAGWGPDAVRIDSEGLIEVDMRRLVARLQQTAREAGAHLRGGVRVRGKTDTGLQTDDGEIKARFIVDASGLKGAGLVQRAPVPTSRICAAAQGVYRVRDRQAGEAFFASRGYAPGEVIVFTGIAGGYSIVNIALHGDRVSILTGSIPGLGHPSGAQILQRFVADHPWIGERIFGGAGAIPLAAPRVLARDNVALVGDAGGQVFAMHGSGVGAGMEAGAMLAQTLADGGAPRDYAARWLRTHGGRFAGAFLFARFSAGLQTDEVAALMGSGLMTPGLLADGLAQRRPRPRPRELPVLLSGAARQRRLMRRLSPVLARMAAAEALYAAAPSGRGRSRWERAVARLMEEQDLPVTN